MKIEKNMFNDADFMNADEKYKVAKHFERFLKNGTQRKDFPKRLYKHLHLHCGFIAHYDEDGFYGQYFNGNKEDLKRFISHFLDDDDNVVYHSKDYNDIQAVMATLIKEHIV